MEKIVPITFTELFELQSLGINKESIATDSVSLESDKFICVRDKSSQEKGMTIIDIPTQETSPISRVTCESAIMNPNSRVLALRAGDRIQTYNLEMKAQIKKHVMKEPIEFWTWISPKDIAIVTEKSVYHWGMEEDSGPVKMFDKHSSFDDATVINYRADSTQKWLLLCGFKKESDGFTKGVMQLFSVDKKVTQPIEGHAACFVNLSVSPNNSVPLICIASRTRTEGKLFIMEVPVSQSITFKQQKVQVQFLEGDFPIAMEGSEQFGFIYLISKNGVLYIYDAESATLIFSERITSVPIFNTTPSKNGFIGINLEGKVLQLLINEETITKYLLQRGHTELAMKLTSRAGVGGEIAGEMYKRKFNACVSEGNVIEAVNTAASSPNQVLRTPEIISMIGRLPAVNGKPPLSYYFQHILENYGKLNQYESVELCKIVLQKNGGLVYIKNLIQKEQLEESEQLGDIIRNMDTDLAMKIYFSAKAHGKIVDSLTQLGDWKRVLAYVEKVPEFKADHLDIFRKIVRINPEAAQKYASQVFNGNREVFDPKIIVNLFVQINRIKEATAFLFQILKEDREEDKELQTLLLEINLRYSPVQVVDHILGENFITHYDHQKIAQLCERVQLYQRALENYDAIEDVKRVIVNTQFINHEWLITFFGDMPPQDGLSCLYELMKHNIRQNLKLVVQIATKYSDELEAEKLVKMFEDFKSYDGLYYYLFSQVNNTKDADIVFKFIEAAVRCKQLQDVERITRENDVYDGSKVKEFLQENRLQNQIPLINVCDKHDMVSELIHYLYNNKFLSYIDLYVKQRNPQKTPEVVGTLIECDAPEEYIKKLLVSVGSMCPVAPLIEVVEEKKRLKLLREWLEGRINDGKEEVVLHNTLGKIYIDTNNDAETFLRKNPHYDSVVLGKYCEKRRDPHLAFIAYERGKCDDELVELTNKNGMFKQQARYLVARQDEELWGKVLVEDNEHRKLLIDQVVHPLLECQSADEVSTTVHAFIVAKLPKELLELLEQIVLKGSNPEFKNNRSLQDLLIITAFKADESRVMGYIKRLDKYNGENIAGIAIKKGMFEEALQVYKNFKMHTEAMKVLIEHMDDLEQASEYAEAIHTDECFALLGRGYLGKSMTDRAIEYFIKANITIDYREVIGTARHTEHFVELIKFLQVARTHNHHDSQIDTELAYAYARVAAKDPTGTNVSNLEDFISSNTQTDVQEVGDRCFQEEMYECARILFTSIRNYSRLASTYVKLGKLREAVNAAQNANSIRSWKEVLRACVEAEEFRYAESCGLNIINHADEIDELIGYYETKGYFDHVISLLEKGLGFSHESQKGIPTALAILYAKYHPENLMEHLQRYYRRTHVPKILSVCEKMELWAEARFLHFATKNFDEAVTIMVNHSVIAWDHNVFTEAITQVINMEKHYTAISFYIEEHPEHVNDLLQVLTPKLDHERVAKDYINSLDLPLFKKYLESVQDSNLFYVNEALNKLSIEEQDYETLRASIEQYKNFDQYKLATQLESHELLEFRRISANLYRMNKKFDESITLSKKDKLYKDAMETASESGNRKTAEDLLKFFVDNKLNDCFAACLYHCYHLVRPDVAMELAWKNKIMDMCMPYLIQVMREFSTRIDKLEKEKENSKGKTENEKPQEPTPFFVPPRNDNTPFGGMDNNTPLF